MSGTTLPNGRICKNQKMGVNATLDAATKPNSKLSIINVPRSRRRGPNMININMEVQPAHKPMNTFWNEKVWINAYVHAYEERG